MYHVEVPVTSKARFQLVMQESARKSHSTVAAADGICIQLARAPQVKIGTEGGQQPSLSLLEGVGKKSTPSCLAVQESILRSSIQELAVLLTDGMNQAQLDFTARARLLDLSMHTSSADLV